MKKSALYVCLLLISMSLHAQHRTGTGGNLDVPKPLDPDHYQKNKSSTKYNGGGGREKWQIAIDDLNEALYVQNKKCLYKGKESHFIREQNFIDTYLLLSTARAVDASPEECSHINQYFTCLYSPEVKTRIEILLQEKDLNTHLQRGYTISKKQSDRIIKFYKDLKKKCEDPSGCKM